MVGLVLVAMILAYWYVGFYPFKFALPLTYAENGAQTQGDWIHFARPGLASTRRAPGWLEDLRDANRFRVELDLATRPMRSRHLGRILTLSKSRNFRNLLIGQQRKALIVQFRASRYPRSRRFVVPNVFTAPAEKTVAVAFSGNELTVAVDGKLEIETTLEESPFLSWHSDHRLTLGNALSLDRPWLGIVKQARLDVDGQRYVYGARNLDIPERIFAVSARVKRQLRRIKNSTDNPMVNKLDTVINVVGFMPFSAFLVLGARVSPIRAVLLGAALSASIELGQFFFNRFPSIFDFGLNILGSAVGAGLSSIAWRRLD